MTADNWMEKLLIMGLWVLTFGFPKSNCFVQLDKTKVDVTKSLKQNMLLPNTFLKCCTASLADEMFCVCPDKVGWYPRHAISLFTIGKTCGMFLCSAKHRSACSQNLPVWPPIPFYQYAFWCLLYIYKSKLFLYWVF